MDAGTLAKKIRQYSEIWTEIRVVDAVGDYLIKQKKPVVNAIQSHRKTPIVFLDVADNDATIPINGDELATKLLTTDSQARIYIRYRCTEEEFVTSGEKGYIIPVEDVWIGLNEAVLYAVKEHVNFKEFMNKTNAGTGGNSDIDDTPDDTGSIEVSASAAFPIHRKATITDTPVVSDEDEGEPTFKEEEFTGVAQDDVTDDINEDEDDDSFDLSILTELLGDLDLNALVDKDENNDILDLETQMTSENKNNASELLAVEFNDGVDETTSDDADITADVAIPVEVVLQEHPRKHLKIKKDLIQQNMLNDNAASAGGASNNVFDIFDVEDFDVDVSAVDGVYMDDTSNTVSSFDDFDFDVPMPAPQQQAIPEKQQLPQINNIISTSPNVFPSQQLPI